MFNENATKVDPLFRTLAAVFEHIDGLTAKYPSDSARYAQIVQDQLSNSLVTLFAFYAMPAGAARFRKLILRFQLLAPLTGAGGLPRMLFMEFGEEGFGGPLPDDTIRD